MEHLDDPRAVIQRKVGDIRNIEIFGNDILVAIYKRPEKTKSGILMPEKYRDEDIYQGKVGMVLRLGPTAFVDDDGKIFRDIKPGDWVVFRPSDGWQVTLNTLRGNYSKDDTVDCRVVSDVSIRMRVTHPDSIW
jgi:co-chaperonin GroES (HSP10)